ncbi:MAG: hypothetical protein ACXWPI_11665, partial [Ktedonobacterales bacterium]
MSNTIVANIGNLPNATGMGQQAHVVYAVNSARWWLFHMASTTSIASYYSADGVTWTAGATLTLSNASTGDGRDMSVAYKNIASTDVIHLTYNNGGSSWQQYHVRGTISGTALTWGSVAAVGTGATTNGQTSPTCIVTVLDSNNKVMQATMKFADFYSELSTNADAGTAWTFGFGSELQALGNNILNQVHGRVLLPYAAGGKVLAIAGNDATASPPQDNGYWSNVWSGAAWGGTETSVGFSDANSEGPNEWAACRLSDTDFHMVKISGTTNTTFEHRRFNGTSWSAGNSIPSLTTKADSGLAMVTDGTSVWLFAIAGDAANSVKYIKWTSGAWGSWTSLETSSQTRNDISVCPTINNNAIQVIWTETVTAGSQYSVVGIQLSTSSTTTSSRTLAGNSAALQSTPGNTITPATAALQSPDVSRTIGTVTAALTTTSSRTITSTTAALQSTISRSSTPATAALQSLGLTRTITGNSAALQSTLGRTVGSASVALQATLSRTLTPTRAALQSTLARTISTATANLQSTISRTLTPTSAALQSTLARTVTPATARLQSTLSRTATPASAALQGTLVRTIDTVTANLSAAGTLSR